MEAAPRAATRVATAFWPLAGTPAYERTDAPWRAALIARFTRDLRRHAVEPWFPRSVNRADGGFWPDFDRRWRRRGPGHWMLEFQARQTRTAARLGLAFPAEHDWWVQTEGVRSLVLLTLLEYEPEGYRGALDALVRAIDRELLDHRAGGWHAEPVRDVSLRLRLRGAPVKGNVWKDASHEVDMYLAALRMLRGLPADAVLEQSP